MTDSYIGQILPFAGNFAIRNMAMCAGQLLSIQQNTALFAILGTTYGGNGQTNFQLPDFRGRGMISWGQGLGLPFYNIGEVGGSENATLTNANLPQHTHTMTASFSAASGTKASLTVPAAGTVLGHADDISGNSPKAQPAIYCPSGTTTNTALGGLNVSAGFAGNNLPVSLLNPYLTITMLIVLYGIFPSRN